MSGIVRYAKLVNLGNYENERLELEDYPRPEETPEQAYLRIRGWVHEQLGKEDPLRDLEIRTAQLRGEVIDATSKLRKVRQRWEMAVRRHGELKALLEGHGVELEALPSYLALSAIDLEQDETDNSF